MNVNLVFLFFIAYIDAAKYPKQHDIQVEMQHVAAVGVRMNHELAIYYRIFRKSVMIPVLSRSANMAPMMGTMRKGLTV